MTRLLRAVVIDDEPAARRRLNTMLAKVPGFQVVGEAVDGDQAHQVLAMLRPDVAFLDVTMPGRSGLEVARSLPLIHRPAIVIVSAHTEYAVDGYDLDIVDYLVKPFPQERLMRACVRVLGDRPSQPQQSWIAVKDEGNLTRIAPDDVAAVLSVRNYARLLTADREYVVRTTLQALETNLRMNGFLRASRSSLVNTRFISHIQPTDHGDAIIRLTTGASMKLSRSFKRQVADAMLYTP